ncbi:3' terminal RNA ribose 2'-O-methyltransferase Hen1 [Candidatus Poriferisodalis sp.]|uniref:3' terminal RNA ribose 2'-O-methyltransferase Hen1 n=1 Tax=Candidatus Poriferisodalis sp. TaxID=3101277 RepID=UPI003B59E832
MSRRRCAQDHRDTRGAIRLNGRFMLVSITSTTPDATDLGFLLHKHPDRVRSVDVGFGRAHVFYPEATSQRCTATLFVEIDPIALSRRQGGRQSRLLEPYVNDRPYVASSMLSVALGRLYRTALSGTCDARPELVSERLDLEVDLPVLPLRGDEDLLRRLFEPLGYQVESAPIPLDEQFGAWGDSVYCSVRLSGRHTVRSTLEHLYVLLGVLDDRKHYWIGENEIDKLLRRGGDWLPSHPESELISRRFLRYGRFAREALARLAESGEDTDSLDERSDEVEQAAERRISLGEQRHESVLEAVRALGGGKVVDLGCGEGRLLQRLVTEPSVTEVLGVDVSVGALEQAERRLGLDEMSERRRERINLLQGALTYSDDRLRGYDIATVVEVIEHVDSERLGMLAEVVFGHAAPAAVVLTTPNREYNTNFEHLSSAGFRHRDHRFEWTRDEFAAWAHGIEDRFGYSVEISGIGPGDPVCGPPTQMAVFSR